MNNDSKTCRFALLLNSCDSYSDTWTPFFDLLEKNWKKIPCNIYLNTETKDFDDKKYSFKVNIINSAPNLRWGGRLIAALDKIKEEYILMTLDDYFVCSPINEDALKKLVDKMDARPEIASFQLIKSRLIAVGKEEVETNGEQFDFKEVCEEGYKTHFVPTLWRKSVLKKWLRSHESIWGFEAYGSMRARMWKYSEKVFEVRNPLVYDYLWTSTDCSAVVNGKWMVAPEIDDFFASNGIDIDLNIRGRITLEEYRSHNLGYVVSKLTFREFLQRVIWRIRSFW